MNHKERDIRRKLRILKHAEKIGSAVKACRYFGVGRATFYRWKALYKKDGVRTRQCNFSFACIPEADLG